MAVSAGPGDAEVRRFAGRRDDALEGRLGHRDQSLPPERAGAELHEAGTGPKRSVGAASHKAGALEGTEQAERGAGRQAGPAGAVGQHDRVLVTHDRQEAKRTVNRASGRRGRH